VKIYAFDVDETLDIAGGPVDLSDVIQLTLDDHCVGLCGNWALVTALYPNQWFDVFSFLGPMLMTKAEFLNQLRNYIPAEDYVMVGNDPLVFGQSQDAEAAKTAGWRFINEHDFADGLR